MHRVSLLLPLLLLAGCPEQPATSPSTLPADPAAEVEAETRLAEGEPLEVESDAAEDTEAPAELPELRYYAFDG